MTDVLVFDVAYDRLRRLAVLVAATLLATTLAAASAETARGISWGNRGVSWGSGSTRAVEVDPALATIAAGERASVIVQAASGDTARAARLVTASGGEVGDRLPLVDGFEARVDGATLAAIEAEGRGVVRAVTLNRTGTFEEFSYDESTTTSSFVRNTNAYASWMNRQFGQGVGIAVVDTGIAEHNDLKGRIVFGPDLSGEGTTHDSYGHGTVMAGLAAGIGYDSWGKKGGAHFGVAPLATLISVKAAGRNGAADVSTILQALHWVSAYREQFNIRVLALAWGVPSRQDPSVDPLNYAIQRLWSEGIVVVTSAGNAGPVAGSVLKPGDDPIAITAGALDDKQNTDPRDDSVPQWSSRGSAWTAGKPDFVVPARTVISPRAFGSTVELENPKALIKPSYIKGSGTSQAAAIGAGLAALLISNKPELTPDQVKSLLVRSAVPVKLAAAEQGAGLVDLGKALGLDPGPASWQTPTATGLGSLDLSRGGRHVTTDCGGDGTVDVVVGEIDVKCEPWNGSSWTGSSWTGSSWTGSSWTGSSWTGSSWTGSSWTGSSWTGSSWTGGTWTGSSWTGSSWTGSSWTGSSWTGSSWTGSSWTGSSWTGSSWTGSSWTTAFWGDRPKAGITLPGEVSEAACARVRGLPTC